MRKSLAIVLAIMMLLAVFSGCGRETMEVPSNAPSTVTAVTDPEEGLDTSHFLRLPMGTPERVDPQRLGGYNPLAMSIFDRVVEVQDNPDGTTEIVPSIAKSWMITNGGRTYRFSLNDTVRFHDGETLTSEDVKFSIERLITHETSSFAHLFDNIVGAEALRSGQDEELTGVEVPDDYTIEITLSQPDGSFLARMASPAASILEKKSVKKAGKDFGLLPETTMGSGPFQLYGWDYSSKMVLTAVEDCWRGAPSCDGIVLVDVPDEETRRDLFETGNLDILDIDQIQSQQDSFLKQEGIEDQIVYTQREEIHFIALNETVEPFNKKSVRKALQLATDRETLVEDILDGQGIVENGFIPHGIIGFNEEAEEIPYDPEQAKDLLNEAGVTEDTEIELSYPDNASSTEIDILHAIAEQWEKVGLNVNVSKKSQEKFGTIRMAGELGAFRGTWTAQIDDPSDFLLSFFESAETTIKYSLCYSDYSVFNRLAKAGQIINDTERAKEYHDLENKIVQEDAVVIPLFSRMHPYAVNTRIKGFTPAQMGDGYNHYETITVN